MIRLATKAYMIADVASNVELYLKRGQKPAHIIK